MIEFMHKLINKYLYVYTQAIFTVLTISHFIRIILPATMVAIKEDQGLKLVFVSVYDKKRHT